MRARLLAVFAAALIAACNGPCNGSASCLASVLPSTGKLVTDQGRLYWLEYSGVHFSEVGCNKAIALSPSSVFYYGVDGAIWSVPRSGGDPTRISETQGAGCNNASIVIDANNAYWIYLDFSSNPSGAIISTPLSGGSDLTVFGSQVQEIDSIAVANGHVYWAVYGLSDLSATADEFTNNLGLWSVPVSGGTPVHILATPYSITHDLATDGNRLYYDALDGIHSIEFDGSKDQLLSTIGNEDWLTFDGSPLVAASRPLC